MLSVHPTGGIIAAVAPNSIAQALELEPGDVLLSINGHAVRDVLDVQFYAADEELELLIRRGDHEWLFQVERDYELPLGLDFTSPTFDGLRRCSNHCEFCFVAQMPPRDRRLRRSLYLRDDDYRYSVLYGSFITLTNLTPPDWQRFQEQRLSPLYISVHATDPGLRRRMLGRANTPDILDQLDRLAALDIEMHAQIVLVPGQNDGLYLTRTVNDLIERHPAIRSIGIVPVGLTRYHRGRCQRYTPGQAGAVIAQIEPVQTSCRQRFGASLVYLADEWYLLAGAPIPPNEQYDDYAQIENGIGLVRQFLDDSQALDVASTARRASRVTLICGALFAPILQDQAQKLAMKMGIQFQVIAVANQLFGETVTVSGLLGGNDLLAAVRGRELGDVVCLPRAMFDAAGARTLDDLTLNDLEQRINRPLIVAERLSQLVDQLE